MKAFRDIEALLRVFAREKELLKMLFGSRKRPALRPEQAREHFLGSDERRLQLLLDHGVVRVADGVLVLEDIYLRFFEEVLEVNEEINVLSVRQHIDSLVENIQLWLTVSSDGQRFRYMGEILRILRSIALSTQRNVIDLKRNIDSTYKNERDYAVKRKRLEILDGKRADIALLISEAERVMDERPPGFFGESEAEVRSSLTESYHNLLELDRQVIRYLNKIEAEQKLVEKIRRVKYLKDQLVWEQQTDVLLCVQTWRPVFLEKRPWYNLLPSLDVITGTSDGIAALKEAHAALRHPVTKRKVVAGPLSEEDLRPAAVVQDVLNTLEIRSAFLGGSQDLMSFLADKEDRLTLFCRIAAEFTEDLRFSGEYLETNQYTYPLIYPC